MKTNLKTLINNIKKLEIPVSENFNFNSYSDSDEMLYHLNSNLFENGTLNHKNRLSYLNKLRTLLNKNNNFFLKAHNLALASKVEQEIGNIKNAINKSTRSYKLFESVFKENKLAVNGAIFAYSTLANIYSNINLNNIALEYLYKAQKNIHECESTYIPKIRINLNLGICYHSLKKYNKALKYLNEIYKLALHKKDYITLIPIIVNMSSIYFSKKNYDECFKICNDALKYLKKINDVNYKPAILCDLAICYEKKKDYKKALDLYNEALKINIKLSADNQIPKNIISIADIYFRQKKYNESLKHYKTIIEKYKNSSVDIIHSYLQISKLMELKKDTKSSYKYFKLYTKHLKDNINIQESMYNDENKNTVESLDAYIDNLEKEKENSKLKLELNHKKRELVTKKIKTLSENNFLKAVINKLKKDSLKNDSDIRNNIKNTIKLMDNRLDNSVDWKQFLTIFDELNPDFFENINGYKNKLTELEIRVCAMIKFGFNTREIASILSITTRGVEQHRYRIKKKIECKGNLTNYLLSL